MADDANGVIYRVAYTGKSSASAVAQPPAAAMLAQAAQGVGMPLAKDREETKTTGTLKVTSPTVKEGGWIPLQNSEYADGLSPELQWSAVSDAKSYAIIMEDPDAKPITPFVHWIAWNIPATVHRLPEGLQEQLRLTEPEGVLQGKNSRGSAGYMGPRPPVGDPPHHYYFQVFALDATLSLPVGADRDELLRAVRGHVIAKGQLMGRFRQTAKPPK
jgi:Raf kinase inhibitor-like YbhB/YbcL family protein